MSAPTWSQEDHRAISRWAARLRAVEGLDPLGATDPEPGAVGEVLAVVAALVERYGPADRGDAIAYVSLLLPPPMRGVWQGATLVLWAPPWETVRRS